MLWWWDDWCWSFRFHKVNVAFICSLISYNLIHLTRCHNAFAEEPMPSNPKILMRVSWVYASCYFPPLGLGGVCHIHAERRDIDAAGRFFVRLWTPRKVRIFHILLFNWMLSNVPNRWRKKRNFSQSVPNKRCVAAVPVAVGRPGCPGLVGLMKPKQEQMAFC